MTGPSDNTGWQHRDQGWCLQEREGGSRVQADLGQTPGSAARRTWRRARSQQEPAGRHSCAPPFSWPRRGRGGGGLAASNMSGQGGKRRDMTDVCPPVSSCLLPPPPCYPVATGHTDCPAARPPHVQMDGGMNVPLTHIECA